MAYGIPEDRRRQIVALYRQGVLAREICERLGVSMTTVMKYVTVSGIGRRYNRAERRVC
jgi:transposase